MVNFKSTTTTKKASLHDTIMPLLDAMYNEFKELSKKKPDTAISKSKITIANRLISKVLVILSDEESISFLDLLDEEEVPQASDVTLIFSQHVAAMKAFRSKYFGWNGSDHDWITK